MDASRPTVPNAHKTSNRLNIAASSAPTAMTLRHQANGAEAPEETHARTVLPDLLSGLFWDCKFDDLLLSDDLPFIIERVLTAGSWSQIRWLRQRVGDDSLRKWIEEREGRPLNPSQLRFWELILGIPPARVDLWLAGRLSSVWERRICRSTSERPMGPGEMGP